jgi:hypothetical protein
MNVEIGKEATQFLFWEDINGIFGTMHWLFVKVGQLYNLYGSVAYTCLVCE